MSQNQKSTFWTNPRLSWTKIKILAQLEAWNSVISKNQTYFTRILTLVILHALFDLKCNDSKKKKHTQKKPQKNTYTITTQNSHIYSMGIKLKIKSIIMSLKYNTVSLLKDAKINVFALLLWFVTRDETSAGSHCRLGLFMLLVLSQKWMNGTKTARNWTNYIESKQWLTIHLS